MAQVAFAQRARFLGGSDKNLMDEKGQIYLSKSLGFLSCLIRPCKNLAVISDLLGLLGLLSYSFFALLDVSKANIGLFMMMAGLFLKQGTKWRGLTRDPMVILSCLFLLYVCICSLVALREFPELRGKILDAAISWPVRGFFALLITAFWLSCMSRQTDRPSVLVLILIFCGFIVRVLHRLDWSNLHEELYGFWSGEMRASFGYSSVILGTWSAMLLFGLVILARRWIGDARAGSYPARLLSWAVAFVLLFFCLLFSQSRTAWVAALMIIPSSVMVSFFLVGDQRQRFNLFAICVFLAILLFISANNDMISNRLTSEAESALMILSDGSTDASSPELISSSIGHHWLLFCAFRKEFMARPVTGWGPGTMAALIESSGLNEAAGLKFLHFHNSYFDVLVEFGILGFGMVSLMFFLILRASWMNFRKAVISSDLFLLIVGALSIFGLCALTDEPLKSTSGGHVISLLGGIAYGPNMIGAARPGFPICDCSAKTPGS